MHFRGLFVTHLGSLEWYIDIFNVYDDYYLFLSHFGGFFTKNTDFDSSFETGSRRARFSCRGNTRLLAIHEILPVHENLSLRHTHREPPYTSVCTLDSILVVVQQWRATGQKQTDRPTIQNRLSSSRSRESGDQQINNTRLTM